MVEHLTTRAVWRHSPRCDVLHACGLGVRPNSGELSQSVGATLVVCVALGGGGGVLHCAPVRTDVVYGACVCACMCVCVCVCVCVW